MSAPEHVVARGAIDEEYAGEQWLIDGEIWWRWDREPAVAFGYEATDTDKQIMGMSAPFGWYRHDDWFGQPWYRSEGVHCALTSAVIQTIWEAHKP